MEYYLTFSIILFLIGLWGNFNGKRRVASWVFLSGSLICIYCYASNASKSVAVPHLMLEEALNSVFLLYVSYFGVVIIFFINSYFFLKEVRFLIILNRMTFSNNLNILFDLILVMCFFTMFYYLIPLLLDAQAFFIALYYFQQAVASGELPQALSFNNFLTFAMDFSNNFVTGKEKASVDIVNSVLSVHEHPNSKGGHFVCADIAQFLNKDCSGNIVGVPKATIGKYALKGIGISGDVVCADTTEVMGLTSIDFKNKPK